MADSMLYTIGTALHHARDHALPVQLLVGGTWLSGVVVAIDGFGVVLSAHDDEHAVVRLEAGQGQEVLPVLLRGAGLGVRSGRHGRACPERKRNRRAR